MPAETMMFIGVVVVALTMVLSIVPFTSRGRRGGSRRDDRKPSARPGRSGK